MTHILGLRAFKSQLLCEQVVGRGLRRMDYTPDPTNGLLTAEYVDIFGVPFSLIPFKGREPGQGRFRRTGRSMHEVIALPERKHEDRDVETSPPATRKRPRASTGGTTVTPSEGRHRRDVSNRRRPPPPSLGDVQPRSPGRPAGRSLLRAQGVC